MRLSLLLASGLVSSAWAAPAFPVVDATAAQPDNIRSISDYFNLLATKVQESRRLAAPPACDLSAVALPAVASGLPPPSPGVSLKHIAIGRGTQNYTCDPDNASATPKSVGALATLFNASCLVATNPDVALGLSRASMHFSLGQIEAAEKLAPSDLAVSGLHYFRGDGTPFFDLDVPDSAWRLGQLPCGKNGSVPAPADAAKGLNGEAAVAWLKLTAKPGATGGLQEVYRVETVGGSPPATCKGMPAEFQVQYSAQYRFYAK